VAWSTGKVLGLLALGCGLWGWAVTEELGRFGEFLEEAVDFDRPGLVAVGAQKSLAFAGPMV